MGSLVPQLRLELQFPKSKSTLVTLADQGSALTWVPE